MQIKSPIKQGLFIILSMLLLSYTGMLQAADIKDINTATATQLTEVKGIGEKTAAAIVSFREKNGQIKRMDALLAVKGVGEKKLINIQDLFGVLSTATKPVLKAKEPAVAK